MCVIFRSVDFVVVVSENTISTRLKMKDTDAISTIQWTHEKIYIMIIQRFPAFYGMEIYSI